MATRIYKVQSQTGQYLVRASARSQAVAFIAKDEITATVATQDDIVSLMQDGRKVIDIKGDE